MYDVLDVSRYIITYCNDKGYPISNLKLQKLLYFVQAYFLVKLDKPCFKEDIVAWASGPVVIEAYKEFKEYGSNNIPQVKNYFSNNISNNLSQYQNLIPYQSNMEENDKIVIGNILNSYAGYSASRLVEITHHQSPWKDAYIPNSSNIISKQSIIDFFRN